MRKGGVIIRPPPDQAAFETRFAGFRLGDKEKLPFAQTGNGTTSFSMLDGILPPVAIGVAIESDSDSTKNSAPLGLRAFAHRQRLQTPGYGFGSSRPPYIRS